MRIFSKFAPLLCLVVLAPLLDAQTDVKTINPTFTTIDVPGNWGLNDVRGINTAGDMVGAYATSNQSSTPPHGFLLSGGSFTYLDFPGAYGTFLNGINDTDLIIGYATFNGGTTASGFFYDGTYSSFSVGNNSATFAWATDNAGDAVGGAGTIYGTRGFAMRDKTFKMILPPGTHVYIYATGVNNLGEIVGWTTGTSDQGFAYKAGKYQTIAVPGAYDTEAWGVNDGGILAGWYDVGGTAYGFAEISGRYVSFAYPGAAGTFPSAINTSGQVVGSYTFDNNTYHGFVTSPITAEDFK
jgi:probable HAF family extracellular repeat protein